MFSAPLSVIFQHWDLFLYLLITQGAFSIITAWFLSDISIDIRFVLSFLGGILGLTLFCLGMVLLKIKPSQFIGMVVFYIALLIIAVMTWGFRTLISPKPVGVAIFFLFILLLRLIFIQDLIFPPYSDSVQHILIVRDFLNPLSPPQAFYNISTGFDHYYHFGFHALVAWLSGATNTSPEQTIMILGQYFQALAILAVFPMAYIITKNTTSSWTVMLIAGLFLSIPAYTSNWGKYPAIASLTGISFTLTLILTLQKNKYVLKKIKWVIGFAAITTITLHSRSFFLILIVILMFNTYTQLSSVLKNNEKNLESAIYSATILSLLMFAYVIYLNLHISASSYVLFFGLTILAFFTRFPLATITVLFMVITGLGSIIPLPSLLLFQSARFNSLFDRTFLTIIFYLPISLIIWAGLDGAMEFVSKHKIDLGRRCLFASILFLGVVNAIVYQNHLPSSCCIFINDDDLFAFKWMEQNLPEDAIVGVAATGIPGNFSPSDGGAWIELLTSFQTRKLDSSEDFLKKIWNLCKSEAYFLYVDNLENSFDEYNLIEAGAVREFNLGTVSIYRLECDFLP